MQSMESLYAEAEGMLARGASINVLPVFQTAFSFKLSILENTKSQVSLFFLMH